MSASRKSASRMPSHAQSTPEAKDRTAEAKDLFLRLCPIVRPVVLSGRRPGRSSRVALTSPEGPLWATRLVLRTRTTLRTMSSPDSERAAARRSRRARLAVLLVVYVCVGGVVIGVTYWISPSHSESAIAPFLGGLIGVLLLSTPPAQRWLERLRRRP